MTKKMDQFLRHWICGGVLFGQGPSSSAEGRMVVVHDTKEVGARQQEEQEDKRDEEEGDEMNGEVKEITHRAHETCG